MRTKRERQRKDTAERTVERQNYFADKNLLSPEVSFLGQRKKKKKKINHAVNDCHPGQRRSEQLKTNLMSMTTQILLSHIE